MLFQLNSLLSCHSFNLALFPKNKARSVARIQSLMYLNTYKFLFQITTSHGLILGYMLSHAKVALSVKL